MLPRTHFGRLAVARTQLAFGSFRPWLMDDGTREIIGARIEVHRRLGPGLLESIYEEALTHELAFRGMGVRRQVPVPVAYRGIELSTPLRLDLLVEPEPGASLRRSVIVEVKSVEQLLPIHDAQLVTYLRIADVAVGLLINFNVAALRRGIRRMVNAYVERDD